MAKQFNGQKMSHGHRNVSRKTCPVCRTDLRMVRGKLRCTEMVRTAGGDRRIIKHGSLDTIHKRIKRGDLQRA